MPISSITTDITWTTLPMRSAALDNPNDTHPSFPNDSKNYDNTSEDISSHSPSDNGRDESLGNFIEIIFYTELVTCIFGAVGNGIVIWLLGFRIKRNPFSTYILNLAVADFGVLLSVIVNTASPCLTFIASFDKFLMVSFGLVLLLYSASQFLLTAIGIDRCVAVFFPLWHRCHRPPRLSTIVSALIWVLSILLTAITCTRQSLNLYVIGIGDSYQFMVNAVFCLPIMTIATVFLCIKACLRARQHRRGKLLTIVLLTLLFFLLFGFPLNVMKILSDHNYVPEYMKFVAALLACLNSSVNPVIYFLVGRQWKSRRKESMKMVLQKVFKEEEGCAEETPVETQLQRHSRGHELLPLSQADSIKVLSFKSPRALLPSLKVADPQLFTGMSTFSLEVTLFPELSPSWSLQSMSQDLNQPPSMEHRMDLKWKLKNIHERCFWNLETHRLAADPTFNTSTDIQFRRVPSAVLGDLSHSIVYSFTVIFCLCGLVGNGTVIWLLGLRFKRNRFTTYILNLAVADFGVLLSLVDVAIVGAVVIVQEGCDAFLALLSFLELFSFTCSVSQFLLAAISIDRSVSVLFPLWHRCHRPSKLSSAVCALIWGLSFLLGALHFTLYLTQSAPNSHLLYQLLLGALFCTPLMVLSALILFIKVCCRSKQRRRGKLVTSILVALLVFLFFAFPLDVIYIFTYYHSPHPSLMGAGFLCASLNSSVNPVIYFLIGWKKKGKARVSVKVALQVVFKGEEDNVEEQKSTIPQTESQ
ncbi:UNVERIFIED_CONTAM: hypothetical protein K2H54_013318 [Gekko kuhli]